MSKDMLGPLTRALVGVPVKMLGLVLDIANRLGSADVDGFYTDLAKFVRGWKKQETIVVYLRRLYETEVIKLGDTVFAVYEQVMDGTFAQLFESLGDKDRLCFASREQIDEFCRVHRDRLRSSGYGNFFLYKEGENFFVASVHVHDDGRLEVYVFEFSIDYVWYAGYGRRFVAPQQ